MEGLLKKCKSIPSQTPVFQRKRSSHHLSSVAQTGPMTFQPPEWSHKAWGTIVHDYEISSGQNSIRLVRHRMTQTIFEWHLSTGHSGPFQSWKTIF